MIKKVVLSGVGFIMLASPVFASADTISDLQAQVQALLAQIAALKAQMGTGTSTFAPTCISLTNNLSVDDTDANSNGEVSKLQQFLANQGPSIYPEARVTGYFGPATMRAVQRWQTKNGIMSSGTPVNGFGAVGPRTRASLASKCGGKLSTRSSVDGRVQIEVKKVSENFLWTNGTKLPVWYTISGSGSPSQFGLCVVWTDEFGRPLLLEDGEWCDTLSKWGTTTGEEDVNSIYKLTESQLTDVGKELLRNIGTDIRMGFKFRIFDATNVKTIESLRAATTIAEDDTGVFRGRIAKYVIDASARNERRVSDVKQLQIGLELYWDAHGRYPVGLDRDGNVLGVLLTEKYITRIPADPSSTSLYRYASRGDGKGYVIQAVMEIGSDGQKMGDPRWPYGFIDGHIVTDGGDMDCNTSKGMYCAGIPEESGTLMPTSSTNKPPVISSFTGPTLININQAGSWNVQATDPEDGPLFYMIQWGDDSDPIQKQLDQVAGRSDSFVKQSTFQHAYSKPGVYAVTATVRDSAGNLVSSKSSVRAGIDSATVDLKVNGSDGPLTVSDNQRVSVNWSSVGVRSCKIADAFDVVPSGNIFSIQLGTSVPSDTSILFIKIYQSIANQIRIDCVKSDGSGNVSDYVLMMF